MRDSCKQKEQQELTVCGQVGAATHLGLCAAQLQDKHRAGPGSNLSPRSGDLGIWGGLVGLGLEWSYASGTWFGWDTWSGGLDSGETIANPGCHLLAGSVQFLSMMACISDCTLDGICEEQIGSRAQDVDPSLSVAGAGARQPYEVRLFLGLKSEVKSSCPCFPAQTHRRNCGSGDLQEDWQGEVGTLSIFGGRLGTGSRNWVPGMGAWRPLGRTWDIRGAWRPEKRTGTLQVCCCDSGQGLHASGASLY
jgi:hypothetical protein